MNEQVTNGLDTLEPCRCNFNQLKCQFSIGCAVHYVIMQEMQ